jgi:hypothetical protein
MIPYVLLGFLGGLCFATLIIIICLVRAIQIDAAKRVPRYLKDAREAANARG